MNGNFKYEHSAASHGKAAGMLIRPAVLQALTDCLGAAHVLTGDAVGPCHDRDWSGLDHDCRCSSRQ